jgi:hypothetical protein
MRGIPRIALACALLVAAAAARAPAGEEPLDDRLQFRLGLWYPDIEGRTLTEPDGGSALETRLDLEGELGFGHTLGLWAEVRYLGLKFPGRIWSLTSKLSYWRIRAEGDGEADQASLFADGQLAADADAEGDLEVQCVKYLFELGWDLAGRKDTVITASFGFEVTFASLDLDSPGLDSSDDEIDLDQSCLLLGLGARVPAGPVLLFLESYWGDTGGCRTFEVFGGVRWMRPVGRAALGAELSWRYCRLDLEDSNVGDTDYGLDLELSGPSLTFRITF